MKVIVEKDQGKKQAKKVKSDIFSIAVKTILLYQDKKVTDNDFLHLKNTFRRICSATRNGYRTGEIETDTGKRISDLIHNFGTGVRDILQSHVSSGTLQKLTDLLTYIGSPDFLVRVSKFDEFDNIAYVLAFYLQETN